MAVSEGASAASTTSYGFEDGTFGRRRFSLYNSRAADTFGLKEQT